MKEMLLAIQQLINISAREADVFTSMCREVSFRKKESLCEPGKKADDVFFIADGLVRVIVVDLDGREHTIHFAMENEFICDYSSFLENKSCSYRLEALENTRVIVIPKKATYWGYENMTEGQKFGRMIAEYYFRYLDNRIKNLYTKTAGERYEEISSIFPNIHNRVRQHMIASYLGITPVHLSRLKKEFKNS